MSKYNGNKSKIALALLGALISSNSAGAANVNSNSVQTVKASGEARFNNADKKSLPTLAKILMGVVGVGVAAEAYNEIAGAISGKTWYTGKYSVVNKFFKNKGGNPPGDDGAGGEQNSEKAKIAKQNIEIIHQKIDNLYPSQEEKAKEVKENFDESIPNIKKKKLRNGSSENKKQFLDNFVNILNGDVALDEKNAKDIFLIKPQGNDDFAIQIYISGLNATLAFGPGGLGIY